MTATGIAGRQMPLVRREKTYAVQERHVIAAARNFAAEFLDHARQTVQTKIADRVIHDVQLVVSELVTNAVKYAPGECGLRLELAADRIDVTVCDGNDADIRPKEHDPARIGQHGLEIVTALCERVFVHPHAGGKCVRARIALNPATARVR